MISTFPAVMLSLSTIFNSNKAAPAISRNSRFKHWEGKRVWEPIGEKTEGSADYDCYKMTPDGTIRGHKHIMHKHVCVTPDNCQFGGVDEYCLECHYGLPRHM